MSTAHSTLILYSTPACHLCETALALVSPITGEKGVIIEEVDIIDSDALIEQYGIRIPVFKFKDSKYELGWPFSEQQFRRFLENPSD